MIIKSFLSRVLFEKVQHTGDCRLTGRFADDQNKPPAERQLQSTIERSDTSELLMFASLQGGKTMNTNDYTIRLERIEDYRAVENLVRESFWNGTVRDAVNIM